MNTKKGADKLGNVGSILIGVFLVVAGLFAETAFLVLLGIFYIGRSIASLAKMAGGTDTAPYQQSTKQGGLSELSDAVRKAMISISDTEKGDNFDRHSTDNDTSVVTNTYGHFDAEHGEYLMPDIERIKCPNCKNVTDTSHRFCPKCDTDLKKALKY